jgi:hypothetical protein
MIAALLLLLAQEQTLEVDTSFQGTPEEAMQAVARLSGDEPERAAALAEGFAEDARWPEALRAEFRYAEGVVRAGAGAHGPAVRASRRRARWPVPASCASRRPATRAPRSSSPRGEAPATLQDPAGAARPPGVGRGPWRRCAGPTSAAGDARRALRADYADPDTRANLGLIQRRLHELDELEAAKRSRSSSNKTSSRRATRISRATRATSSSRTGRQA